MKPKSASSRILHLSATIAIAVVGSALVQPTAQAANGTWTQSTSGGLWSASGNWTGTTVADASGSTAFFNSLDLTADNTVHLDSARTLTALNFADTGTSSPASWILDNNGIAGNILTLAATPTITVGTGSTARIDGVLSGAGVSFSGPGTLILTNANTFTGTFTMNGTAAAGAVRITRADAFGSAILAWGGNPRSVLELDGSGGNINFTKALGDTSGYILRNVAGTNTVTSSMNMFTGAGGTKVASDGGALTLSGSIQSGQGTRTLELSGSSTGANAVSGLISPGNGTSLLKTGTGTWILTNANTYVGGSTISAGTLVAGVSNATSVSGAFGPSAAAVTLGDASTTTLGSSPAILINGAYTVSNPVTVANQATSGVYTIGGRNASGTATFTGNVTLNQAVTLQAATGGTTDFITGTWVTNNKVVTVGSAGNLGTVRIDNAIATSGGVNVSYGTLALNGAFTSGTLTVASGATLSGIGSTSGAVTLGATGRLSPTAQASGSNLVLGSTVAFGTGGGSIFEWNLTTADKTNPVAQTNQGSYGQVAATGSASGSAVFNVVLLGGITGTTSYTDAFWKTNKTWNNVFSSSGLTDLTTVFNSFSGDGLTASGSDADIRATAANGGYFAMSGTSLTWNPVPEPTSALAGLLLGSSLLRRRRVVCLG